MNWINTITPENFDKSFDLKEILKNSTFILPLELTQPILRGCQYTPIALYTLTTQFQKMKLKEL